MTDPLDFGGGLIGGGYFLFTVFGNCACFIFYLVEGAHYSEMTICEGYKKYVILVFQWNTLFLEISGYCFLLGGGGGGEKCPCTKV